MGMSQRSFPMDTPTAHLPTLPQARRALWLATLSLMAAFMQTQAPAHRLLMARRIARNFDTLREQECFSDECRVRFGRLAARWRAQAERLQEPPLADPTLLVDDDAVHHRDLPGGAAEAQGPDQARPAVAA